MARGGGGGQRQTRARQKQAAEKIHGASLGSGIDSQNTWLYFLLYFRQSSSDSGTDDFCGSDDIHTEENKTSFKNSPLDPLLKTFCFYRLKSRLSALFKNTFKFIGLGLVLICQYHEAHAIPI